MARKHYLVIGDGELKHSSSGIDSARLWARKYNHAVILECAAVPLEDTSSKVLEMGITAQEAADNIKEYIKNQKENNS